MRNRKIVEKRVLKKQVKHFINQFLLMILMFLLGMISTNQYPKLKDVLRENVFEKSFSFLKIRKLYDKYFQVKDSFNQSSELASVFQEEPFYQNIEELDKGVKLQVKKDTPIPMFQDGLIVFIGDKDGIPTVIVDLVDGVSVTYQNLVLDQKKLYDYVEKNDILGRVEEDSLFLTFEKEGNEISYKEYI